MKATHIYISKDGIPMAPTNEILLAYSMPKDYDDCKKSAIPIREEDRYTVLEMINTKEMSVFKILNPDFFYVVEPYEFDVETAVCSTWLKEACGEFLNCCGHPEKRFARIKTEKLKTKI